MKAVPFGEALVEIRTGPFGSLLHKSDYVKDGIPLINPMHILDERIAVDSSYSIAPAKAAQLSRYGLQTPQ